MHLTGRDSDGGTAKTWHAIINVLLGEMSLVGSRPEHPIFVQQFQRFIPCYMDCHRKKAGMTGWATEIYPCIKP